MDTDHIVAYSLPRALAFFSILSILSLVSQASSQSSQQHHQTHQALQVYPSKTANVQDEAQVPHSTADPLHPMSLPHTNHTRHVHIWKSSLMQR